MEKLEEKYEICIYRTIQYTIRYAMTRDTVKSRDSEYYKASRFRSFAIKYKRVKGNNKIAIIMLIMPRTEE